VKLSRCWTDGGLKGMDDPLALLRLFLSTFESAASLGHRVIRRVGVSLRVMARDAGVRGGRQR
jgi:hypothetical protein